jgi:hypothetical protein
MKEGPMSFRKVPRISALAGTIAITLWAWIPAVSNGSPAPVKNQASYAPIQNIRYDFGSKSMSGYFVEQAATCLVMLMVFERSDPDKSLPPSATRLRLILYPGQIVGLDSEEGRSLNFTCGERATTLLVDVGERDRLVALQGLTRQKTAAD